MCLKKFRENTEFKNILKVLVKILGPIGRDKDLVLQ